jgi:hypothetical protein
MEVADLGVEVVLDLKNSGRRSTTSRSALLAGEATLVGAGARRRTSAGDRAAAPREREEATSSTTRELEDA